MASVVAWQDTGEATQVLPQSGPDSGAVTQIKPPWEQWAAGAWGIWSGAEDSAKWTSDRAIQSLNSWYSVTDKASLFGIVDQLKRGQTESRSWDLLRAVDLVRIGQAAGYVDSASAGEAVRSIASLVRAEYGSWEEVAKAFEVGMHAWQTRSGITGEAMGRVQRNLPYLRTTVWPSVDWNLSI